MPEPTRSQKTAFKNLQKIDPNVEIRWDAKTGAPAHLRGVLSGAQEGAPERIAHQFLSAYKGLFTMKAPEQELQLKDVGADLRGNRHVRFQQKYQDIPVFGAELYVHLDGSNAIRGVNGTFETQVNVPTQPQIAPEQAVQTALVHDPHNEDPGGELPDLLILMHEDKSYLAWHITLYGQDTALDGSPISARWEYFVNAISGEVIWRYNNEQGHDRTTGTGTGKYGGAVTLNTVHNHTARRYELEDRWLPGTARIYTHDANNGFPPSPPASTTDNSWADTSEGEEVDCHLFSRMVYDYFLIVHGRNSYDNSGADMHIYAHVGNNWNNASWNGSYVKIGDGDKSTYDSFCTLDIVAHEWTHAVTEYTAGLIYSGESGALNESMSDVFAALIDGDWLQGKDNWLPTSAPAGRNLADPTNGGQYDPANPIPSVLAGHQPDHMNDKYTGAADGGGVHINSGIMNKAAYLVATGGTHRGITVCEGLGRDVLGRLYYQALTQHLTSSADFAAMREAVLDSLDDLYSDDPRYNRWRASIINAFAAVGVGSAVPCPLTCLVAPIRVCPLAPTLRCPPAPGLICPVSPLGICPSAPVVACPSQPSLACPPSPTLQCPPSPSLACPPSPRGCLPGPDPMPFQPKMRPRAQDEEPE